MSRKLLVVDDIEINRRILFELFSGQYDMIEAENGHRAIEQIKDHGNDIAVVLLDLMMPVLDGFAVLRYMNESDIIKTVPVILITGENDDEKALEGYQLGVSDMIMKPFNPDIVHKRVKNIIDLYEHKQHLEQKLKEQKEMLEKQSTRLKQANQFVIDTLSTTVEFRSMESGEHIKRIRILTRILLEKLSSTYPLTAQEIEAISNASAVHDIGKIAIPDNILLKPGPLTKPEFEVMKTHTLRGCEILESLNYMQDKQYYTYCYEICRHHHERWDGKGYPDGLAGEEISIWAQATSLADVYDALTSKRIYKSAFTHDEALKMIVDKQCGMFNPEMMAIFLDLSNTLPQKIEEYTKEDAIHAMGMHNIAME